MAEQILLITNKNTEITGINTIKKSYTDVRPADCGSTDVVVIDHEHVGSSLEMVRKVRSANDPSQYLSVIVLMVSNGQNLPRVLSGGVDAVIHASDASAKIKNEILPMAENIKQRIESLRTGTDGGDTSVPFKLLRHLYSRQSGATPAMTISSKAGFVYPQLDMYLDKQDTSVIKVLGILEDQGMLTSQFVDKMYACSHCGSAFMNFQEACGHCGSTDLEIDDLIHHFRCAYVAPRGDFTEQGGGMTCPKCKHSLKEIGVDYDKPSEVYICRSCGHTSQEVDTMTTCYNCLTKNPPENLDHHVVKKFALTALGDNAARFGMEAMFMQVLEQNLEIVPMNVFKKLLLVESERIKRYGRSTTSLMYLQIANLNDIYAESSIKAKEIFGEFSEIMRSVLRTSDIITGLNESSFLVLLIETPLSGAESTVARIKERVESLISNNFKVAPDVVLHAVEVSADTEPDSIIDKAVSGN